MVQMTKLSLFLLLFLSETLESRVYVFLAWVLVSNYKLWLSLFKTEIVQTLNWRVNYLFKAEVSIFSIFKCFNLSQLMHWQL